MLDKGYGSTTVSDITERADVGRSTFYAHYADKEDLLQQSLQGLRHYLNDASLATPERDGPSHVALSFSLPMFEHSFEQRRLFRAVLSKPQDAPVQHHLQVMLVDLVAERLGPPEQAASPDRMLQSRFIVGAFLGVLFDWLSDPEPATPQSMDRTFRSMMMVGLAAWPNTTLA
jgi:AcrR family transcriptional regulator